MVEDKRIAHTHTDEMVCPFCGYEHGDSWELGNGGEGHLGKQECPECEREFFAYRDIEVTYSTMAPCDTCGRALQEYLDEGATCRVCVAAKTAKIEEPEADAQK